MLVGSSTIANTLDGAGGDDILKDLGSNNDSFVGGAGTDMVDYTGLVNGVDANLTTGKATGADIGIDSFSSIENLTGGGGADTLTGDGGDNVLSGGDGNDVLIGHGSATGDTYIGGNGSDTVDYSSLVGLGGVTVNLLTSTPPAAVRAVRRPASN